VSELPTVPWLFIGRHRFALQRCALLTLVSETPNVSISDNAADWVDAVAHACEWDKPVLQKFIRFVVHLNEQSERYAVLRDLNEEAFEHLKKIDDDLWKSLANVYCDWVEDYGFGFDYCDVLVRRIEKVFELGDLEVKANCAIAAAELAISN
jgi:eukaryotic-like serine/threonine-protein kinase